MIRQLINVNDYWKIIVYYNIDYNLLNYITYDLYSIEINNKIINRIYKMLYKRYAKAVTISNGYYKTSIVIFNKHKTKADYINSIVHEAEHVKQAMLKEYNIDDYGEAPAYTIGFIVMKMLESKVLTIK